METLQEQVFQATHNFLTSIQELATQHATRTLQETFASLSDGVATPSKRGKAAKGVRAQTGVIKRDPDALEQLSKRFGQFVQANPGMRIEQINKQLGTTTKELALPIRKLIASGEITVKGARRATTYFAGEGATAQPVADESKGAEKGKARGKLRKKRSGKAKS